MPTMVFGGSFAFLVILTPSPIQQCSPISTGLFIVLSLCFVSLSKIGCPSVAQIEMLFENMQLSFTISEAFSSSRCIFTEAVTRFLPSEIFDYCRRLYVYLQSSRWNFRL